MKVDVLQATTSYYYHVVPGELERVTITPEERAIFEYLSRIGSDRFVEFITDILVHVEKHTLIDKTDGPGDEKQDILTLDPQGNRHLTQCKHTMHYRDNNSGDELDLLVGACLRKECRSALYVTNADLTVQAKRYINDREYLRGWPKDASFQPHIDYWNGERLWKRIAGNEAILNKWFGGMAQSHGLRLFFTDIVVLQMPGGEGGDTELPEIASGIKGAKPAGTGDMGEEFVVEIGDAQKARMSSSIATPVDLRIPFSHPTWSSLPPNVPFHAIRVHASVNGDAVYDPEEYRNSIATVIGDALPAAGEGTWWYVAVGPPQAFVFLQDVAKPVLVPLGAPETFVRVGAAPTSREHDWALTPGEGFVAVARGERDDELTWRHPETDDTFQVLVSQGLPMWQVANLFLRQRQIKEQLKGMVFRAIQGAGPQGIATVRRLAGMNWTVLHTPQDDVIWAYPKEEEKEADAMAETLERQGVEVLPVEEEDKARIIKDVQALPMEESGMIANSRGDLLTPLQLQERIFWLTSQMKLTKVVEHEKLMALAHMKVHYEQSHGFDLLEGKESGQFAVEELPRILADILSLRGKRMLDIAPDDEGLMVSLRIRADSYASATEFAQQSVKEMESIKSKIAETLAS
jgi:hypothetical protein